MKWLLTSLFALALAAPAQAAPAEAKLLGCDVEQRKLAFQGDMKRFRSGTTLQMRFTLQVRTATASEWRRVAGVSGFDAWATAAPGVKRYLSDKELTELAEGATYRSVVRFRWRDAAGAIVARAVRKTKACRQPDERANVKALKVTRTRNGYAVRVVNVGEDVAPVFAVGLTVNGVALADRPTDDVLFPDEETEVTFESAPCSPGTSITARVDTGAVVDEANEMDNVLDVPCGSAA